MLLHNSSRFIISFGTQQEAFAPQEFYDIKNSVELLQQAQFIKAQQQLHLKHLVVLKQTHSDVGYYISSNAMLEPYSLEGDFLITNVPRCGIGVNTADCLPIIFYDTIHHALAIAHAGWLGTIQEIAKKTFRAMQAQHTTQPEDLEIFFGPSAKPCCYEVQKDFVEKLTHSSQHATHVISAHEKKLYCDVPLLNQLQLQELGIKKEHINYTYNLCTICSPQLCSYRRDGAFAKRQMTIAVLI